MLYCAVPIVLFWHLSADQERDKSQYLDDADASQSAPPDWAELVGSTESNKYHRVQCWMARRIRPEKAIWFADVMDATANGYVAAACRARDCRPPLPAAQVPIGELGGGTLPPPTPAPPEIPKDATPPVSSGKSKTDPARAKSKSASPTRAPTPPPRMPPLNETEVVQVWQGISIERELDARRRWDVWAEWTLDRWCERWHISSSGRINTDSAYSPKTEQLLIAKLKAMKEQMADNRKRIAELKAIQAGKKKP
jgi:hypothetical protein